MTRPTPAVTPERSPNAKRSARRQRMVEAMRRAKRRSSLGSCIRLEYTGDLPDDPDEQHIFLIPAAPLRAGRVSDARRPATTRGCNGRRGELAAATRVQARARED